LLLPGPEDHSVNENDPKDPGSRYAGFEAVPIPLTVRIGRARCKVSQLASLEPGVVIALDRPLGAPFDLISGDVELARVEPVAGGDTIALKLVSPAGESDDAGH
jgi:flagellar motor switch/type III secretory pathway protein FliN